MRFPEWRFFRTSLPSQKVIIEDRPGVGSSASVARIGLATTVRVMRAALSSAIVCFLSKSGLLARSVAPRCSLTHMVGVWRYTWSRGALRTLLRVLLCHRGKTARRSWTLLAPPSSFESKAFRQTHQQAYRPYIASRQATHRQWSAGFEDPNGSS